MSDHHDKQVKLYMVGGAVRDELLGKRSKDIDYAVEADSYTHMLEWVQANGKVFLESPQHFTIRAHLKGHQPADFVLCRKEYGYTDGRHPDKVEAGTLLDDLARRDFTVNAIAKDSNGNFIDPHNGMADLKAMVLRCVGNPLDRFTEDALRVMRAMRFSLTKGFRIHSETKLAMWDLHVLENLKTKISVERKQEELTRCLAHDTIGTLDFLHNMGIEFQQAIFTGKLWLKPTLEDR